MLPKYFLGDQAVSLFRKRVFVEMLIMQETPYLEETLQKLFSPKILLYLINRVNPIHQCIETNETYLNINNFEMRRK